MTVNASRRRLLANASSEPDHDGQLRTIAKQFGLDPQAIATTVVQLVAAGVPRGEARQRAITSALLLWPLTRHDPTKE